MPGESYEIVLRARDELTRVLKEIGPVTQKSGAQATGGLRGFLRSLREGELGAARFGRAAAGAFRSVGRGITRFLRPGIGQIALLVASIAGLGGAVRGASAFSQAMAEVGTIVDTTAVSMERLREGVLRTSKELGLSELTQAKALYQAISAGIDAGADSLLFLEKASRLAVAGVSDTASTVDLLTNVLNAYRLEVTEAERVSDILFETVRLGKTTISELASGLSVAIPLAAQLGVGVDQLGAAIATITAGGGGTTSEAATQIAAVLRALLTNFEQIQEAVRAAGGEFSIASIRSEGLAATLQKIRDAAGGSEDRIIKLVTRAEALNAVLNLTGGNLQRFVRNIDDVADSSGATERALRTQMEDPAKRVGIALSRLRIEFQETFGRTVINAAARAIEFAGGVEGAEKQVQLLGKTLGTALGSAIEGFGRLIGRINEFQQQLGGTQRITRIAVAGAEALAASLQLAFFTVTEAVANLIEVIARLPAEIDAVIRDLPIISFISHKKTEEDLRREKAAILESFRFVRSEVERLEATEAAQGGAGATRLRTLRAELDRLRLDYRRLTDEIAGKEVVGPEPSGRLGRLRAEVDARLAALRAALIEPPPSEALTRFSANLTAPIIAAFAVQMRAGLTEASEEAALDASRAAAEALKGLGLAPPDLTVSPEERARQAAYQKDVLDFERALAQTAQERIAIIQEEARLRRGAIGDRQAELSLTDEQVAKLLELSERLTQIDISKALDFESFEAEVSSLSNELVLSIDEQREAIARWADAERERIALLQEENRVTAEQAERLRELVARLEEQKTKQAETDAEAKKFRDTTVSVAEAIGQNAEGALARMVVQLDFTREAFKRVVDAILEDLLRLIIRQAITGPLFGLPTGGGIQLFAEGGIARGGLSSIRPLAQGGIVRGGVDQIVRLGRTTAASMGLPFRTAQFGDIFSGPHLAVIGEGKKDEAVVPLENNRSIPVEWRNGPRGGGGVTIIEGDTYHVQAIDVASFEDRLKTSHRLIGEIGVSKMTTDARTRRVMRSAANGIG